MLTGVTSTGFEYTIADDNLDDMELLDALAAVDNGNILAASKVCTLLFGKEQKKALYDHVRDENGKVRYSSVVRELTDIILHSENGKN